MVGGQGRRPSDPTMGKSKGCKKLRTLNASSEALSQCGAQGVVSKRDPEGGMREAPTQGLPRRRAQQPHDESSASKQKLNRVSQQGT